MPEVANERHLTGEELARMGSLDRAELVEGRLVHMSPTGRSHGRVELRMGAALEGFVRPRRLGEVLVGEVGIYTRRNPDSVRGADLLFISGERIARLDEGKAFLDVAPELIVEVLSPDDRVGDLNQKLREYFEIGVRLVWVADPAARSVHVYRSPTDLRVFTASDTLTGDDVLPGFEVEVERLFAD